MADLVEVAATEKTGRVREEVLCLLSLCLLTFPSSDLDLQTISQTAAGALADRTRRVRQAAMECLALAAQCLGHQRRGRLMEFVCELDRRERSHGEMVSAVRARISRNAWRVPTNQPPPSALAMSSTAHSGASSLSSLSLSLLLLGVAPLRVLLLLFTPEVWGVLEAENTKAACCCGDKLSAGLPVAGLPFSSAVSFD